MFMVYDPSAETFDSKHKKRTMRITLFWYNIDNNCKHFYRATQVQCK